MPARTPVTVDLLGLGADIAAVHAGGLGGSAGVEQRGAFLVLTRRPLRGGHQIVGELRTIGL
jgi:hypothetical protein